MAILFDMPLVKWEDGILVVSLEPPVPVGGWDLRFVVQKRFGAASGLILKSCASGYGAGQSGIRIVNSGQGIFNVSIGEADTSGLDFLNYAASVRRVDSGSRTVLSQGFLTVYPDVNY